MYITVLVKYRHKLGPAGSGGDWDGDTAVVHAANDGITRCNSGRPDAPRSGVSKRGWEQLQRSKGEVTCAKCRKALGLAPLEM